MIEKIITSKTRAKLLKLFLSNIDDRYYLRELERMLGESLSPLRRQLLKLTKMGILTTEYEANLKYYRLNKNFPGIEELRRLVLSGERQSAPETAVSEANSRPTAEPQVALDRELASDRSASTQQQVVTAPRRMRYDIAILMVVSLFVLGAATFVVYTSTKNIKEVASLVSEKTKESPALMPRKDAQASRPDEMISRRWKVLPGNFPVLSGGGTDE